jgi:CheY-like chemotaxis protein
LTQADQEEFNMKKPVDFIIVDDDVSSNFLCARAIQVVFPSGTVRSFNNPAEGLKIIAEQYNGKYEKGSVALFIDINMPGLDGWGFLKRFEKFEGAIREQFMVYMLSSSIDPEDEKCTASHPFVSGFLSKPVTVKGLRLLFQTDRLEK